MVKIELSKETQDKLGKLADVIIECLQVQTQIANRAYNPGSRYAVPMLVSHLEEPPTEEEKATVEAWIKEVDPVVQKEATAILADEIRSMMLMGGNVKAIAGKLKEGKKPRLVRKKEGRRDPLYIQLGDGVEEPIEEIYVLG
jgi:hypothetical protein